MLYLFHGTSRYLLRQKTLAWKQAFMEKYGDINLTHITTPLDYSIAQWHDILSGMSFLTEKKLIIIDDIPLSSTIKNTKLLALCDVILQCLENIPEDTIVLFSSHNPDKRSKLFKYIKNNGDLQEFHASEPWDIAKIIGAQYPWVIDHQALGLLMKYTSNNLAIIISEIQKLLISRDTISMDDIREHVMPELEESIFQCIDDILSLRMSAAIAKIDVMLQQSNMYGLYNNLLANLRPQVFIMKAKNKGISDIGQALKLWNRAFLVNKQYKISLQQLETLYLGLIGLDKKMKSWKLLWSEQQDFQFELEKLLLQVI